MASARLGRLPSSALRGRAYASASTSTLPPRTASVPLAPAVPKPPSATWYTGSPYIVGLQRELDSLVHRTRHLLHSARILTRYSSSPDFAGTGIRLRFLRWKALGLGTSPDQPGDPVGDAELRKLLSNVPWKTREDFETEVQGAAGSGKRLKPSEYDQFTGQLSELRRFQLYIRYALGLGGIDEGAALRKVDEEIGALVARFARPVKEVGEREGAKLERDEYGRYAGLGRKKHATARAWIVEVVHPSASTASSDAAVTVPGQDAVPPVGRVVVNGQPISEYFTNPHHRAVLLHPFVITRSVHPSLPPTRRTHTLSR